jgi:hypothetical protein
MTKRDRSHVNSALDRSIILSHPRRNKRLQLGEGIPVFISRPTSRLASKPGFLAGARRFFSGVRRLAPRSCAASFASLKTAVSASHCPV